MMIATNELQTGIPKLLEVLSQTPSPERVLSAYLDTAPQRVIGLGHLLAFQDACKQLREQVPAAERDAFEAAVSKAESVIKGISPAHRGLAVFTAGREDYVFTASLPVPPLEQVVWSGHPVLEPLEELLDEFERVAVLLFDNRRARLMTIYMGELEAERQLQDDVPSKQERGGWFALAQTRYERHRQDHLLRHAKRAIQLAMDTLRATPFDRLILAGPDEAVALFRHHMPKPLQSRLAGTLRLEMFAETADILKAGLQEAYRIERQGELSEVQELTASASTPLAELGFDATLNALNDNRVHRLLLADAIHGSGSECAGCGWIGLPAERCPRCGTPTSPIVDVADRAIQHALQSGATVEIVSGEAATQLMERGGLAAWTRY